MLFDPRIHPASLSNQDLETLQLFGVRSVLAVADATAHPATPEGILRHFDALMNKQVPRLERSGLEVWVALGVHGAVLPRRGFAEILEVLPQYLRSPKVRAIGQLSLGAGGEREREALIDQLALADTFHRAALITTSPADRERQTKKLLATLQSSPLAPSRIVIDGATGRTVRGIREWGYWAGLSLHPDHLTVEKAVSLVRALGVERLLLDTGAGDGSSDILALGRAAHRLAKAGLSARVIRRVTHDNARLWLLGPSN